MEELRSNIQAFEAPARFSIPVIGREHANYEIETEVWAKPAETLADVLLRVKDRALQREWRLGRS